MTPFSIISSSESVYATSLYPGFQLQDPSTALVLSSIRDHPIRLNSAFDSSLVSSYSLVNENTEAFICPHSLLFTPDGSRFIAGSDCLISVFDIARPGSAPIALLPTITNKRRKTMGGGVGMKGIVSALAVEPSSSILAVGTFTGHVGLYNDRGEGDTIGIFSLTGSQGHRSIGGRGVTQIKWSPCGKYLYVSERMSSGVLIYDIRDTGQLLGWLEGREAMTNQRLGIDVFGLGDGDGHEIWAGGTDGIIKVWMNPHQREAAQAPSWNWRGHEGEWVLLRPAVWVADVSTDAITSTQVHPTGSVVATCSGQRRLANPMQTGSTCSDSDSEKSDYIARNTDNSLKIWDLGQSWTSKVIQDIGISKES